MPLESIHQAGLRPRVPDRRSWKVQGYQLSELNDLVQAPLAP